MWDDFGQRLRQAAEAGLTGRNVKTRLAASAVEQIAGEIVRRVGKKVQMDYLKQLLTWVLVGVGVGLVIEGCSACLEYFEFLEYSPVKGYGTVFAASMVGAWISVAAFRREVALADLPQFIDWKHEPKMRLIS